MMNAMDDCLFCKIVASEIPADVVYEDDHVVAFRDINPQAPVHVLVIPREHHASWSEAAANDPDVLREVAVATAAVADQQGLGNGYRVVANTGDDGGQTVHHLHLHLLGGRHLTWPPG